MRDPQVTRQHLIALNSGETLARDSICKLALGLDQWIESAESATILSHRHQVPQADFDTARRLVRSADTLADRQQRQARSLGVEILTLVDDAYPEYLHQLELPPPVLYIRGRLPTAPAVAIVGSRRATSLGLEVAELFGRELAACGLTVISGFARGIDMAAHRGAVSAAAGRTVAVLGCGLDVDYPRRRSRIRSSIASRGALVSEFPFAAQPLPRNFPIRNRIIAALSLGTLVVQGTPKSGSLITARLALDLGRDVYAVPGSIFEKRSAGPNALIQDGALLVKQPDEILESLPISIRESLNLDLGRDRQPALNGPLGELLASLSPGQMVTADQLVTVTGEPLDRVLGSLMELEMLGLVKRLPGAVFCRKP